MSRIKIISGGQTGVDRGALDAALVANIPCGGWCPKQRRAEDGCIPARYPLLETESSEYKQRTLRNVIDSDGTLVIYFGKLEGGTKLTTFFCRQHNKPYKLINACEIAIDRGADLTDNFVLERGIKVLNVAGPRASREPQAYDYTFRVMTRFLQRVFNMDSL